MCCSLSVRATYATWKIRAIRYIKFQTASHASRINATRHQIERNSEIFNLHRMKCEVIKHTNVDTSRTYWRVPNVPNWNNLKFLSWCDCTHEQIAKGLEFVSVISWRLLFRINYWNTNHFSSLVFRWRHAKLANDLRIERLLRLWGLRTSTFLYQQFFESLERFVQIRILRK